MRILSPSFKFQNFKFLDILNLNKIYYLQYSMSRLDFAKEIRWPNRVSIYH